ncbi:MAG: type II toxin-antitoxin system RelE/ParE family toxin [Chitinophagales bacterium]|nr:type II toxin-antitoxin system RelE/ParE family toxin [Chitinophagales bacterium]
MAKRKIIWSKLALSDRYSILDYWKIRNGNKRYSNKLDKAIRNLLQVIASQPNAGRILEQSGDRYVIKDAYQIVYSFDDDWLIVLHIWDMRRNPEDFIKRNE